MAAYHLAEVYNTEGDYAAADALLQSLPQRFNPDEAARHEYENYMNLQRLRESVAGNWYRQTDTEISELQQVAESDSPVHEISVYELTGRTMMTIENCSSIVTINVVSLPRGIYLLRAVTENGVKTARFVKN